MLDDFENRIASLGAFDFGQELETIVEQNTDEIVDLQRKQMLEGRGADGEYIRPFYSENPYFKSAAAAQRYAEWKQRIAPNPLRPLDVPNLFITGLFHDSLRAKVNGELFEIETDASFGQNVFDMHKNAQGLDEDSRLEFAETITLPAIQEVLLAKTGLKITSNG